MGGANAMPRDGAALALELRPCAGFPGYSVDAEGVVYSHLVRLRRGGYNNGFTSFADPARRKRIAPEPDRDGYLRVRLRRDGRRVWARINVLVCTAFEGPPPDESSQCRHLDGDRHNNRADNLCWGTPLENTMDKFEHGTVRSGPDCPNALFDRAEIVAILDEYAAGMAPKLIAALRGCSVSTVRDLIAGRTYKRFRTP